MATIKKAGTDFYAKVDTNRDLFGEASGFEASYVNDATGTVTDVAGTFSEVIRSVAGASDTASADALAGAKVVSLNDATGFEDGDTIKDANGNMYYVESINGTDLNLKSKLVADITSGDAITQVGNTGIYRVAINISTAGDYTIVVDNPDVNMQNIAFPVTIADEILDDAQTKLDNILNELGISGAEISYKGFV
jgi:uncharacterized membrane protein YvbJ